MNFLQSIGRHTNAAGWLGDLRVVRSVATTSTVRPTAVVTGANTGIGFETSKSLVAQGYDVIMACRDAEKAAKAKASIMETLGAESSQIEILELDLADLESVSSATQHLLGGYRQLDLLVNNAGIMAPPLMRTTQGFESQFGVNHLGHFAFTLDLLPLLTSSDRPSRIVTVSSLAHWMGRINLDDPNYQSTMYNNWEAYGQSKLANVLFAFHLARNLPAAANCTSNTLHPGIVNTELQRYLLPSNPTGLTKLAMQLVAALPILKTPAQGAETSLYLATHPDVANTTGKYYQDCKPAFTSVLAKDTRLAEDLWNLSLELTGREQVAWNSLGVGTQAKEASPAA